MARGKNPNEHGAGQRKTSLAKDLRLHLRSIDFWPGLRDLDSNDPKEARAAALVWSRGFLEKACGLHGGDLESSIQALEWSLGKSAALVRLLTIAENVGQVRQILALAVAIHGAEFREHTFDGPVDGVSVEELDRRAKVCREAAVVLADRAQPPEELPPPEGVASAVMTQAERYAGAAQRRRFYGKPGESLSRESHVLDELYWIMPERKKVERQRDAAQLLRDFADDYDVTVKRLKEIDKTRRRRAKNQRKRGLSPTV